MHYKLITGKNIHEFQDLVNSHIQRGYTPLGGVTTQLVNGLEVYYFQAMSSEEVLDTIME